MRIIPLLIIPVALYNLIVFLYPSLLDTVIWDIGLVSGAVWSFSVKELLLALGIIFLYLEILKSTRTSTASIIDHTLSLILSIVCILEFITVSRLGHSGFMLLTLMCLVDVVAGFTVTISTARRDIGLTDHVIR